MPEAVFSRGYITKRIGTEEYVKYITTCRYTHTSFFLHILCLYTTRWVMTDPLFDLNVHILAWLKALYFITLSALSRRKIVRDLWVSPPEFLSLFSD